MWRHVSEGHECIVVCHPEKWRQLFPTLHTSRSPPIASQNLSLIDCARGYSQTTSGSSHSLQRMGLQTAAQWCQKVFSLHHPSLSHGLEKDFGELQSCPGSARDTVCLFLFSTHIDDKRLTKESSSQRASPQRSA